ncbi:hypothetical protein F5148DRAFT_1212225 [Russula earlei]|uniref:Uncharacterized protein n=1 Tax=Russula earlei TaxID=71964 RepID=A0ACC0U4S1_9AGAM|nr:hypothetical protein F5148DRAFT_1212225 [Russula earlei]
MRMRRASAPPAPAAEQLTEGRREGSIRSKSHASTTPRPVKSWDIPMHRRANRGEGMGGVCIISVTVRGKRAIAAKAVGWPSTCLAKDLLVTTRCETAACAHTDKRLVTNHESPSCQRDQWTGSEPPPMFIHGNSFLPFFSQAPDLPVFGRSGPWTFVDPLGRLREQWFRHLVTARPLVGQVLDSESLTVNDAMSHADTVATRMAKLAPSTARVANANIALARSIRNSTSLAGVLMH